MFLNFFQRSPGMHLAILVNLFYLWILFFVSKVDGFQCYVCDSKKDIECLENLPPDTRLVPQDCGNITGAKFCVKTTGIYAGILGTTRFCSANDGGNYCKYVKQPTGDRDYRSCVLTCSSENCNGSSRIDKFATFNIVTWMASLTCTVVSAFRIRPHVF